MQIEIFSILALLIAIILGSIRTDINTGIASVALAFVTGCFIAGYTLPAVSSLFPSEMFLTLLSITLLFYIAKSNGTLDMAANAALALSKGNSVYIPLIFFFITFILSAIGAGNIAAVAIVAPVAMSVAYKAKVSRALIAIIVCTGANAGAFSPFAPTGIISASLMKQIGIQSANLPFIVFMSTALLQSLSAFFAYFIFRGYRNSKNVFINVKAGKSFRLNRKQLYTITGIGALIFAVIFLKLPVNIGAFIIIIILSVLKAGDQEQGIKLLPWGAILMVTGVTMLVGIIDKTGGLRLISGSIAKISSHDYLYSSLAFITGFVSLYSSSSGVVMPAFIPMLPDIINNTGGDIIKGVIAVNVGSHMVDVSPFSTLGALCLASAVEDKNKSGLFRSLLIWGFSMIIAAALLAYIFLDVL